jgi:hypothetical protein
MVRRHGTPTGIFRSRTRGRPPRLTIRRVLQGRALRREPGQDAPAFLAGKDHQHILAEDEGQDLLGIAPMDEPGGVKALWPHTEKTRHVAPPSGARAASG